jgi:hypothetical protein
MSRPTSSRAIAGSSYRLRRVMVVMTLTRSPAAWRSSMADRVASKAPGTPRIASCTEACPPSMLVPMVRGCSARSCAMRRGVSSVPLVKMTTCTPPLRSRSATSSQSGRRRSSPPISVTSPAGSAASSSATRRTSVVVSSSDRGRPAVAPQCVQRRLQRKVNSQTQHARKGAFKLPPSVSRRRRPAGPQTWPNPPCAR